MQKKERGGVNAMTDEEILKLMVYREMTLRDFFKECLCQLWAEVENFSGERPLGDSGWQLEIYSVLIKHGVIKGKLDKDGNILEFDYEAADKFIIELIVEHL